MQVDDEVLRRQIHHEILRSVPAGAPIDDDVVSHAISRTAPLLARERAEALAIEVLADVHGLGPLDPLLADPQISDVMVVSGRGVWIERNGVIDACDMTIDEEEVCHLVERIIGPLGLRVDRASPMIDARLSDGSRVNVIVPPLAIDGTCLTIRRFGARHVPLDAFASRSMCALLIDAVRAKKTIVISGGTGAGKTTLPNALARFIDERERIITIEDTAELRLPLPHVVRLEGRPANAEGAGRTTLRELVRNALRMRPDRIVLGEVRGGEALDMLQAMNTGHEGSLSTCHANSPRDALSRLETMVLMADAGLPVQAIRDQIASAVDLVVQVRRGEDGSRRISDVARVERRGEAVDVVSIQGLQ